LSGTLENWKIALEKGVWGVSEKAKARAEARGKGFELALLKLFYLHF
jgi:predicted RNA-binding protein